jgi:hypothetical protein
MDDVWIRHAKDLDPESISEYRSRCAGICVPCRIKNEVSRFVAPSRFRFAPLPRPIFWKLLEPLMLYVVTGRVLSDFESQLTECHHNLSIVPILVSIPFAFAIWNYPVYMLLGCLLTLSTARSFPSLSQHPSIQKGLCFPRQSFVFVFRFTYNVIGAFAVRSALLCIALFAIFNRFVHKHSFDTPFVDVLISVLPLFEGLGNSARDFANSKVRDSRHLSWMMCHCLTKCICFPPL